ncbi:MAG TPA: SGNH/GDSL hydrolase family protein [Planctomycetota bacterium]|nr:SGNH/GDSL hydrolase family protein [Planctomycetota bacterium]
MAANVKSCRVIACELWLVVLWIGIGAMSAADAKPAVTPTGPAAASGDPVKKETWDYVASSKEILKKFTGKPGVVLHLGDSITRGSSYGAWALEGKGQTDADKKILQWMHAGAKDDTDGWTLAHRMNASKNDSSSETASNGMRTDELIKGGKNKLPPLDDILKKFNPQMVVLMLGTNDIWQKHTADDAIKGITPVIDKCQANGTVVILSSIPPNIIDPKMAEEYNNKLYELAKARKMPYLDYYGEIIKRAPDGTWDGTIMIKGDVHPNSGHWVDESPTEDNFKRSGYLLRTWLSVQKIREVKEKVIGQ